MATSTESVDLVGDEAATNLARAALFAALVGAFRVRDVPESRLARLGDAPGTRRVPRRDLPRSSVGAASIVLYLAAGALGAPVFQGGSAAGGPARGPVGGLPLVVPARCCRGRRGRPPRRDAPRPRHGRAPDACRRDGPRVPSSSTRSGGRARLCALARANRGGDRRRRRVPPPAEALKIAAAVGIVRSDAVAAA